jgi:hypothetical protein
MRAAISALTVAAALAVVPAAGAATTHSCAPTNRTDQFLHPDPHGIFGIFQIKVTGATCAEADTVTNAFYRIQIKRSNARSHLTIHGYACVLQAPDAAQQLKAACFKGKSKRIRFHMEIPNG